MGGGQSIRNGRTHLHRLPPRKRPLDETFAERLALQQFHDGIDNGAVGAVVMDGENVGMRKGGHGAGFPLEPRLPVGVARQRFRQNFDGHFSAQPCIAGTIYLPHAARAKRGDNLIRAKTSGRGQHGTMLCRPLSSSN